MTRARLLPPAHLSILASVASLALLAAAGLARAETVEIQTQDLVGGALDQMWHPLRVVVSNHADHALDGHVVIRLPGSGRITHRAELLVPARGQAEVSLIVANGSAGQEACFASGELEACTSPSRPIPHGAVQVLLVQQEFDFRPGLASVHFPPRFDGPENGDPPERPAMLFVALLSSGDEPRPVLPDRALGYHGVRLVIAEAALLGRLEHGEAQALFDWVRTGGGLALVWGGVAKPHRLPVMGELSADSLHLAEDTSHGARRPLGLGMVHHLERWNELGGDARHVALASLVSRPPRVGSYIFRQARLAAGPYPDPGWGAFEAARALEAASGSYEESRSAFGMDPNRTDRQPILLYLLVVLVAAVLLSAAHRRWTRRGGNPWGLFVQAAGTALAGCLCIFLLGHAFRGPDSRYRSMGWIAIAEGQARGLSWQRLALFSAVPGSHVLPFEPGRAVAAQAGTVEVDGEAAHVVTFSGGQWQTDWAVDHGIVDLGGSIRIRRDGSGQPVAVENGLPHALEDAVLVGRGRERRLGDIGPGQTCSVTDLPRDDGPDLLPPVTRSLISDLASRTEGRDVLVAEVDRGCPDRGSYRGDRCLTTVAVLGAP